MVWSCGRQEFLKRARLQNIKVVRPQWVDDQEKLGKRLDEADYAPFESTTATPKRFKDHSTKLRSNCKNFNE